jgi:hypothetical protein
MVGFPCRGFGRAIAALHLLAGGIIIKIAVASIISEPGRADPVGPQVRIRFRKNRGDTPRLC